MPSHAVISSPIASRKLPPGRSMPRSSARNIKQRLGEKFRNTEVVRRALGDEFNEWNDRRIWNDNISGGAGLLSEPNPPPPPENLDWNNTYRRREMSPNIEAFMNFNDQPEPEYNNEVYVGPERFSSNDFQRGMKQPAIIRNFPDLSNSALKDSFSSGDYHSFEGRRGDSGFMESSSSFNYGGPEISPQDYTGQRGLGNDQWRPYELPAEVAKKRRREPSPRVPERPRAAPEILDKVYHIGGYKLPYITNGVRLPQPESKSFLARFFKKSPAYRITRKKGKERSPVEHVYLESMDVNEFEDEGGKHFSLYRFREDIAKELTKVYRGRFYRTWDGWWKDFNSINLDIDKELDKFEDFNVKYNFMPPGVTWNFADLINKAKIALTKNRNNYLGNMRIIYGLMDHTILANMPMEAVAKLQDLIRSVPNHLWIYKLRCMVYLWYNYKQVMDNKDTKDKKYQHVSKEWNSPVIHWVAKQAFNELRNISQTEYPAFNKLYRTAKGAKA
ncbi:hypothetical protein KR059_002323 [Drosophila kikkawai]|nr:hypothetical protein KR059_002323 [Drosophila kikkawai]